MTKLIVLLAVENHELHQQVKWLLPGQRFEVLEVCSNDAILECFRNRNPHLLILEPPRYNGVDIFAIAEQIRKYDRRFPVILVTTHGSEALAVAALRAGFKDYFKQPILPEVFTAAVERFTSDYRWEAVVTDKPSISDLADNRQIVGQNVLMRRVMALLQKVASVGSHVLITGETGTGKELAVQYIHRQSARRNNSLISINCAALPDNLLESELFGYEKGAFTGAYSAYAGKLRLAEGGTVFLDEIGDMSSYAQAKLLRILESKEAYPLGGNKRFAVNIRIIAATNRDLEQLVANDAFRKDLFYRLNVARIHLPPLRERKDDIPFLIDHYLAVLSRQLGLEIKEFTPDALELLLHYDWPGNIRELKNLLEALLIETSHERIEANDLPAYIRRQVRTEDELIPTERELLLSALMSTHWNKSKAAEQLHWSRMTLYRKMAKYHI
ncbi:sigma 54-interacting transcriptional regulator [Methylocaldum sp. MU1018]